MDSSRGHRDLADVIAKCCLDHYSNKLPKTGKPQPNKEWTILSGIVMEYPCTGPGAETQLKVVALATGSKCIGHSEMSPTGFVVHDSHAEVLARRAFLRFLYDQLNLALEEKSGVFDWSHADGKFHLKSDVAFHLFCSGVPCGDAAIFPIDGGRPSTHVEEAPPAKLAKSHRLETVDEATRLAAQVPRTDTHRTGAKCTDVGVPDRHQPGADYHVTGVLRTKPGRGHPTLSMSCSDKIAKWNVLGLQGCLLSLVLAEPVYLVSITVGKGPYDARALQRAVVDRNRDIGALPTLYRVVRPILLQSTLEFLHCREAVGRCNSTVAPAPSAIVWSNVQHSKPEVVVDGHRQGTTIKARMAGKARCAICRYEMFRAFHELCRRLQQRVTGTPNRDFRLEASTTYGDCKLAAGTYREARRLFHSVHSKWKTKPEALTEFRLED